MKNLFLCLGILGILGLPVFAKGKQNTAPAPAGSNITVVLLTDAAGIDDRSFNASAWRGILEFYGDTWDNPQKKGSSYQVITAQTQDMYLTNLQIATDEKYTLIAAAGFTFADPLAEVAKRNPKQKYLLVDVDTVKMENVLGIVFAEQEGSYLVGAAAALKAQEEGIEQPKFGFIGGVPDGVITKFEVGFVQGVLSILPDAEIVDYYVDSWGEPGLAKTKAKSWYDAGVYAIYSAAGNSGNGTIAQAKEYRYQGKQVWAIGVDSDQHEEGLYRGDESAVLTSMLKRVDMGLLYGLTAIRSNTFKGEVITLDLKANGIGYTARNPALTPEIKTRLEQIKQDIIAGQIRVVSTYTEAKQLPGFPQNLKALDN